MNIVYLLLGSNLDNRAASLQEARNLISASIGHILHESAIYESEAWGFSSENQFLNQVVQIDTSLDAPAVIDAIHRIEKSLGRERNPGEGYASRIIDIDILFYNSEIIRGENLEIPHPKIQERMFTLIPLSELDGAFIHPSLEKSVNDLLGECDDQLSVKLYLPDNQK
jgi:2-amino-4-hydroxy-6-hydroxymethyldihydropteridine diphosphokinase